VSIESRQQTDPTTARDQLQARWKAVAAHEARELASMSDERAREIIASLGAVDAWRARPDWSGLVEQQALFHRRRAR
jgi:hypothetical protein